MTTQCTDPEVGERLAAYELGLLAPAERRRFEEHLTGCIACRDEAFASADVATAMTGDPARIVAELGLFGRLRRAVGSWASSPRGLVPALAVAGAVAFVVVARWTSPSPASLARIEPLAYVPLPTRDARADDAESLFQRGMERYAKHEYIAAVELLRRSVAESAAPLRPERLDQANLFLGVSLLLEGDAAVAIAPLESSSRSALPVLADRARWYLAQAKLLRGEVEPAARLLEQLADSPGYAAQAGSQLERLRALRR
jgi:hypothetical protein